MFVNVKKTLIQFLLLLLLLSIVIYTFFFYFYKKENLKENKVQISKTAEPEINDETSSLIKGINYSFNNPNGLTAPGSTPNKLLRYLSLAKDIFPMLIFFCNFFKSILVV